MRVYTCLIRKLKPKTILEVGSGFSTLVADTALEKNGDGQIISIEPYPRPFVDQIKNIKSLVKKPVQELSAEYFNDNLNDGDILFIDSTHTVKIGSDCLHLYLRIIPEIRKKIFIHIHDIFLPMGMLKNWALDKNIFWTEQYLLQALIRKNPKYKVIFGSHYHGIYNNDLLIQLMNGKAAVGEGGSYWLQTF